ncbi:MAG: hypothetical protein EB059_01875 [Alphaproteobacteria bacterium]|nr:hypothetical protein [Alphaproteobacteria bacterium]
MSTEPKPNNLNAAAKLWAAGIATAEGVEPDKAPVTKTDKLTKIRQSHTTLLIGVESGLTADEASTSYIRINRTVGPVVASQRFDKDTSGNFVPGEVQVQGERGQLIDLENSRLKPASQDNIKTKMEESARSVFGSTPKADGNYKPADGSIGKTAFGPPKDTLALARKNVMKPVA